MNIPSQGEPSRNRVSQSSWKGFHIKYTKDNQGLHLWDQGKPLRCQPLIGTLCHGKFTPLIEARKNNLLKHLRSAANPMNQLWISHNHTKAPIPTGFSLKLPRSGPTLSVTSLTGKNWSIFLSKVPLSYRPAQKTRLFESFCWRSTDCEWKNQV